MIHKLKGKFETREVWLDGKKLSPERSRKYGIILQMASIGDIMEVPDLLNLLLQYVLN